MEKKVETKLETNAGAPVLPGGGTTILVKHEIVKDNAMVMGMGYGVVIGLLAAIVIQGVLRRG